MTVIPDVAQRRSGTQGPPGRHASALGPGSPRCRAPAGMTTVA